MALLVESTCLIPCLLFLLGLALCERRSEGDSPSNSRPWVVRSPFKNRPKFPSFRRTPKADPEKPKWSFEPDKLKLTDIGSDIMVAWTRGRLPVELLDDKIELRVDYAKEAKVFRFHEIVEQQKLIRWFEKNVKQTRCMWESDTSVTPCTRHLTWGRRLVEEWHQAEKPCIHADLSADGLERARVEYLNFEGGEDCFVMERRRQTANEKERKAEENMNEDKDIGNERPDDFFEPQNVNSNPNVRNVRRGRPAIASSIYSSNDDNMNVDMQDGRSFSNVWAGRQSSSAFSNERSSEGDTNEPSHKDHIVAGTSRVILTIEPREEQAYRLVGIAIESQENLTSCPEHGWSKRLHELQDFKDEEGKKLRKYDYTIEAQWNQWAWKRFTTTAEEDYKTKMQRRASEIKDLYEKTKTESQQVEGCICFKRAGVQNILPDNSKLLCEDPGDPDDVVHTDSHSQTSRPGNSGLNIEPQNANQNRVNDSNVSRNVVSQSAPQNAYQNWMSKLRSALPKQAELQSTCEIAVNSWDESTCYQQEDGYYRDKWENYWNEEYDCWDKYWTPWGNYKNRFPAQAQQLSGN
eukprot:TRINITY_DN30497_c0_g2_i1.p1 TRINITY_DN30497_c0_g2~~TRINITY_DN30497_c0_g2_i1.p1  ORF type:complete len:577 (+),score=44.67 TRINITY_DN30497_c0_g2_i1:31-1761(+)